MIFKKNKKTNKKKTKKYQKEKIVIKKEVNFVFKIY
jgi:hypothetical protein